MRWKQGWYHGSGIGIAMLAVALATACAAERAAGPGSDNVINMWSHMIDPARLTARPGQTVVWYNATPVSDAEILFEQGKAAFQACADPVGFIRPAGGDYYTGPISAGEEASLCIPAPGIYDYRVIIRDREGTSYRGRIVVK